MNKVDFQHPAVQIVQFMKRIYDYGMTTTSGGNLSILDENGDMWISPGGIDKGTLTPADIVCVKKDGTIVGKHKPSCEFPFHQGIYKANPEARAVVHAHPPMLVAFSIAKKVPDMNVLANSREIVGIPTMAGYGCPGSMELGGKIQAEFAKGFKAVLLENHGAVVCGSSLLEAFQRFETYDFTARLISDAIALGTPHYLTDEQIAEAGKNRNTEFVKGACCKPGTADLEARAKVCDMTRRAYRQKLFSSTEGTCALRIDGDHFVITSKACDRGTVEAQELITVKGNEYFGCGELDPNTWLAKKIFAEQPELNALIFAHPTALMAYGVADVKFDTRLIPESYLLLREVPVFDFGVEFSNTAELTKTISPRLPVVLVKNDFVLTAGKDLLQALDRLEVAEYSAKGAITASKLGELKLMGDDAIQDIIKSFNLIP